MRIFKKVLLVVPRYGKIGDFYQVPLGLAYIASAIKSTGCDVVGLNLNHEVGDVAELVKNKVRKEKPQVIATGGLSVFIDQIREIVNSAKSEAADIFTIAGGGVVSGEPDVILDALGVDVGVINEGEETVVEILKTLNLGGDISGIQGVVVRTINGRVRRNGERPQRKDLENISWPDYRVLDLHKSIKNQKVLDSYFFHMAPNNEPRSLDMISSRSCPFKCTFCFHPTGKEYRERPMDDFFAELETVIKEFNVNMVGIVDELFSLKRRRLLEFCERIKPFNVKWMVQLHVNSASEETLRAMADSGCVYISYGIESMSQPVLDSMQKKSKIARVEEALALTQKYKIGIQGNLLFGDSAETLDTANESMHWWSQNRRYQINLTPLIVFPGSPDYLAAVRDGLIKREDREAYVRDIPTDLNISSMNNRNMDMVRFMVYVYFESLFRIARVIRFEQVDEDPHRGAIYDCDWVCGTCSSENKYENFIIPQDCKHTIRMTCRSCGERFDVENKPFRALHDAREVKAEARKLLEQAIGLNKLGRFQEAHDHANRALGMGDHFIDARLFLAEFYDVHGPQEHCLRSYGSAVSTDPFRADLHFVYARALHKLRLNGGALLHIDQAISLSPNYGDAQALKHKILSAHQSDSSLGHYFGSWSDDPPPSRINRQANIVKQSSTDELEKGKGTPITVFGTLKQRISRIVSG